MKPSWLDYVASLALLMLIGILLVGCSQQPKRAAPPPVTVPCQKPDVDSQLLEPLPHLAVDHLLQTLGLPPLKLDGASPPQ